MTPNLGGDSNEEFEKRFWTNNETISISLFGLHRGELFHNVGWDSLWRQRHLRRALHLRDGLRHRGDIQHDHKSERRDNGRGVVVVGDTLYYTTATTNSVFSYTLSTSTDNGALFTVAGASALSTMAYDGTDFWIGDYSGTNQAYLYSPTGTLLKTISLGDCTGFCDGLEYFVDGSGNARLIENEADGNTPGIYDVYDTSGNLITHDFINTGNVSGTGIAYDGTDFFVSNIFQGTISVYDNTGTFIRTETLTGFPGDFAPLVEDLSADYAVVLGNPPTPEPATFATFGAGLLGLCLAVKRRKLFSKS